MRRGWMALGILCLALAGCPGGTGTGTQEVDPEFVVNVEQDGDQMNPVVAAMPSGVFLVVWESGCLHECMGQDGSEFGVYARRYEPSGVPLGGEFRVNDEVNHNQAYPHAAMLPDGRFAIVWANESGDSTGDAWDVRLKLYGSEGVELTGEIPVNTATQGAQWWPQVGLASDGVAQVVWQDEGAGYGIMGRRFDAYGDPLAADALMPGSDGGEEPALASVPDGRAVLVFSGGGTGGYGILGLRLAQGEVVGDTLQVSEDPTAQYPMPAVAMAPTGEFVVAWSGGGDGWEANYDIRARSFSADASALSVELQVNVDLEGMQTAPAVTVSQGADQFLVSWESALDNGANKEIIAKTYLLDGTPRELDFVVNSYQAQMQDAPSSTSTFDGFLVAWQSSPESGDGFNVYLKLYPLWP